MAEWRWNPPTDHIYKHDNSNRDDCNVDIVALDWTDYDASALPNADVVLGSDLVYSPKLIRPLCNLIGDLLNRVE